MIKILSVDDSKAVHAYIKSCLDQEQFTISHAMSGMDALNLLKINPNFFDIILLDWEMPLMNGPEALVAMKKLGVSNPIVMVTTKNKEEDIKMVLEKGATEYIMKPFTADIIKQKILDILG